MISVDNQEMDWQPGMTLAQLLARIDGRQHIAVVRMDGKLISLPNFAATLVPDETIIDLIPLVAGG